VYGTACIDGRVGIWMDLIPGATLEQLVRDRGRMGDREAALVGLDLCRALAAVHQAGCVHRDVKAQNVMREDGGRVVLMDFGTGREDWQRPADSDGDLTGTPLYLAPELFRGASASQQSDIYSLGVLLYHLVTEAYPIEARTLADVEAAHQEGRRRYLRDARPDLPAQFVRVVERALSADPAERYGTAGAMEAALLEAIGTQSAAARIGTEPSSVRLEPAQAPAGAVDAIAGEQAANRHAQPWLARHPIAAACAAATILLVRCLQPHARDRSDHHPAVGARHHVREPHRPTELHDRTEGRPRVRAREFTTPERRPSGPRR
jgi:tRNA A-37 threonylcarbamoyl transferase component Bud32